MCYSQDPEVLIVDLPPLHDNEIRAIYQFLESLMMSFENRYWSVLRTPSQSSLPFEKDIADVQSHDNNNEEEASSEWLEDNIF